MKQEIKTNKYLVRAYRNTAINSEFTEVERVWIERVDVGHQGEGMAINLSDLERSIDRLWEEKYP